MSAAGFEYRKVSARRSRKRHRSPVRRLPANSQTATAMCSLPAHDGTNATAYLWRGENYAALGYLDRAVQGYPRCLEIDPAYGANLRWPTCTSGTSTTRYAFSKWGLAMATSSTMCN